MSRFRRRSRPYTRPLHDFFFICAVYMDHARRRPQLSPSRAFWALADPRATLHHRHARDNPPRAAAEYPDAAGTSVTQHAKRRCMQATSTTGGGGLPATTVAPERDLRTPCTLHARYMRRHGQQPPLSCVRRAAHWPARAPGGPPRAGGQAGPQWSHAMEAVVAAAMAVMVAATVVAAVVVAAAMAAAVAAVATRRRRRRAAAASAAEAAEEVLRWKWRRERRRKRRRRRR